LIAVLSGGTGTPKLLQGLKELLPQDELAVIVNTAEDRWLPHGYFSPDIDTVIYTLAGVVDDTRWHGIEHDTYVTHETLKRLGSKEYLHIGDRDRAVHIWRGEWMREGARLSEVTGMQCRVFGVEAKVLPMSDDAVATIIGTAQGEMDLHEFWVKRRGEPEVLEVRFRGLGSARACGEAVDVLEKAERIIIGPSNPVTSIHPIISLPGINSALRAARNKVMAVSPLIGSRAFSGPAVKLMRAFGMEASAESLAAFYSSIASHLVVDNSEDELGQRAMRVHKTNIAMPSMERRVELARFLLEMEI